MRTLKLASLLACCALVANVYAQDEGRRGQQSGATGSGQGGVSSQTTTETTTTQERGGRRGGMARGGMMQVGDRDFAAMLSIGNQGEIEMANFVKDKLQNDQAKQFANQMIQDHTQFLQQLGQVSGRGGQPGQGAAGNAANAQDPAGGITPRTATPDATGGQGVNVAAGGVNVSVGGQGRSFYAPGMNPMLSIKQEIPQECLNMTKKELGEKQGVEVDKCYIGTQIVKHVDMIAQLQVAQRHAQDSQFKEMLGTGLQKAQHHLEMAKGIMKQLDQQKSGQ